VALLAAGCAEQTERAPAPAAAPAPAPAQSVSRTERLSVEGTSFRAGSTPFHWRGISAFRLLELMARGREKEAEAFLAWASSQNVNVVRVLAMAHHLFQLNPEEGRKALPGLLERAAVHGVHVEIVALADTAAASVDVDRHVKLIGDMAAHYPNAIVEIANEPGHPTQRPEVHSPERLKALASSIPEDVLVALGSVEYGDGFAAGDYVTTHLPRDEGGDRWDHVRSLVRGVSLIERFKKPVVSDEPIGAGAEYSRGRRDNDPARFRAAALLTRLAGMGATFHYEGGLHARVPEGAELECFRAWNEAWTLLPEGVERDGSFEVVRRDEYRRLGGGEGWVLLLPPVTEPTSIPGWRVADTRRLGGATLVRVTR
jgi:hypothetical protein